MSSCNCTSAYTLTQAITHNSDFLGLNASYSSFHKKLTYLQVIIQVRGHKKKLKNVIMHDETQVLLEPSNWPLIDDVLDIEWRVSYELFPSSDCH